MKRLIFLVCIVCLAFVPTVTAVTSYYGNFSLAGTAAYPILSGENITHMDVGWGSVGGTLQYSNFSESACWKATSKHFWYTQFQPTNTMRGYKKNPVYYAGDMVSAPSSMDWNYTNADPNYNYNVTACLVCSNDGTNVDVIAFQGFSIVTELPSENVTAHFNMTPANGPVPLYVQFDDTSLNTDGTTIYNWSITPIDGVVGPTASVRNHSAYFVSPGIFTVSHGVEGPHGSDIETQDITIYNGSSEYVTTGFAAMDLPRWVQLSGATINLHDVGNGSWKNTSSSTTGYEEITTFANSTIDAYASMTGYSDISLTGKTPWNGGTYTFDMLPTGYANVSSGNVTLYVSIWGSDVTSKLVGATVNMVYLDDTGQQIANYRITDSSGMVSFVVPNQTTIYLYAEMAGYANGATTVSSGDGDGGTASVYEDITLQRLYVTTAPTATTLPGGGTPTTAPPTVDPYPCDADHPENCQRKQTELANDLIAWAPDLVNLFIIATIIGVLSMMMKGFK